MPNSKPTKAQLVAELAQVVQERDDARIALETARRDLADYQARHPEPPAARLRPQPKLVELQREVTPQGEALRVGDTLYQATISPRADGNGFKVVAPISHAKPLLTSLSPAGIGYLPDYVLPRLVKAEPAQTP